MDFLAIKNGQVIDAKGAPFYMRGVNIGGWMNLEHFLNGYPGSESNLRRVMKLELGAPKAEFFFERLLDHFFGEKDVQFLAQSGITVVRLPLNYRHFESDAAPREYLERGFARLDTALDWCEKHSLYAILDLHAAQGWQNGDWHCDNSSRHALFWTQRDFQDRFVALWEEFARRYKNRAVVAAYNLLNEPLSNAPYGRFGPDHTYQPDWENMNRIYRRAVAAIRAIDPEHIIILEGDYFSTRFSGLDAPFADNLMYSNHNYIEPMSADNSEYPGAIRGTFWDREKIASQFVATEGYRFASEHNVPLFVGELGWSASYPSANVSHKVSVFSDHVGVLNQLGCHWAFWSYKDLGRRWLQTAPDSPYNQTIRPMLAAKAALGVDVGWLGGFPAALRTPLHDINDLIVAHLPGVDRDVNFRYLSQATMSTFTADQLQTLYAQQFAGKTETELDDILASFAFDNCVEVQDLSRSMPGSVAG